MQRQKRWLSTLWPPLAYLALAVVLTWPLTTQLTTSIGGGLDPLLQTWVLAWNGHALLTNPLHVWHAPIFFPYPDTLAYSDHHLLLALAALPILALGEPILAYNLLLLVSFALSGWAVMLLALALGAVERPMAGDLLAAFGAGAIFAFGTYRMTHLVHLQLLQTAWLPFALLFLHRYLRAPDRGGARWRDALLSGVFAGMQCITALYYAYFTALALGLFSALWFAAAGWHSLRARAPLPWRQFGGLALGGGVALAITVPLTLPYLSVYQYLGIVRSPRELDNWSAPLQAYLATPPDNWLYGATDGLFAASGGEFALFPGFLTLGLALAGVWLGARHAASSRRRDALFLVLLGLGGFVLSLGSGIRLERGDDPLPIPLPYSVLYERLPGFGALRVPARWAMLVHLALALLAGSAALKLWRAKRQTSRLWVRAGLALTLIAAVLEHLALPVALATPPPAPPVYAWLGAPEQRDIRALLELPVGATPRGAELDRMTLRQFYQMRHWRPLAVGYSGLIPFGVSDMLRRVQRLPDDDTVRYLALLGVDTLVVHRNEYDPVKLAELLAWADATPLLSRRAEIDAALVYSITERAAQPNTAMIGASVFISADERVPGMPALALTRRWADAGALLYGAARIRYYPALATPQPGQVFAYGLLASGEDPAAAGFDAAGLLWVAHDLAFYAGDPQLRLALDLGRPVPGQFHPAYPAKIDITVEARQARIDDRVLGWEDQLSAAMLELDIVSLEPQTITIGGATYAIAPGLTTIAAPVMLNETFRIAGRPDVTALRRLRIRAEPRAPAPPAADALAVAAECRFAGSRLLITARAGGAGALLIDVRGAAAADDKPIHLLAGIQPIAPSGSSVLEFGVDLLQPAEPWVTHAAQASDGRYQVYLKSAANPDAPGIPIAKFNVRNGMLVDPEPVPLPLTIVR